MLLSTNTLLTGISDSPEGLSRGRQESPESGQGFASLFGPAMSDLAPPAEDVSGGDMLPPGGNILPPGIDVLEQAIAVPGFDEAGNRAGEAVLVDLAGATANPDGTDAVADTAAGSLAASREAGEAVKLFEPGSLTQLLSNAAQPAATPLAAGQSTAASGWMAQAAWSAQAVGTAQQSDRRMTGLPQLLLQPGADPGLDSTAELARAIPSTSPSADAGRPALSLTGSPFNGDAGDAATPARLNDLAAALQAGKAGAASADAAKTLLAGTTTSISSAPGGESVGLHSPLATQSTATTTALPPAIGTPLRDPGWGNALGERVVFMTNQNLQTAEVRVTPRELGPITINLVVDDGVADLTFTAQHAVTREAIEVAIPRLRDMLADSGLSLGNASVADHGVPDERSDNAKADGSQTGDTLGVDEAAGAESADTGVGQRVVQGLVDTFA